MRPRKTTFAERAAAMKERLTAISQKPIGSEVIPIDIEEAKYTVAEAAKVWGKSIKTTRRDFHGLEGVREWPSLRRRGVRPYMNMLIPRSVLEREIRKVTNKAA
jgi:hypothetical protein